MCLCFSKVNVNISLIGWLLQINYYAISLQNKFIMQFLSEL
jgi:hypothetical protein